MDGKYKMEVKAYTIVLVLFMFLLGCRGKAPEMKQITGEWVSQNSAKLKLNADGTFQATKLPIKIFWWPDDSLEKFDGHGSWKLVEGQSHWELHLHFEKTTARDLNRFNTSVMLAREGDFETGREWYIFLWVGEEGDDKYKFKKK